MSAEILSHPQFTETKVPENNLIERMMNNRENKSGTAAFAQKLQTLKERTQHLREKIPLQEKRQQLAEYLEKKKVPLVSRLFNKVREKLSVTKLVTAPSQLKVRKNNEDLAITQGERAAYRREGERSVLTRSLRKELHDTLVGTPKEEKEKRREIIGKAHELDRIGAEFLRQSEVTVDLGEYGEQKSRFTVLHAPEHKRELNLPPVVLIGGISNDLDPVAGLAQALAESGRDVIVIAYPESTLGSITPEFAEICAADPGFTAHAEYFRQAIESIKAHIDVDLSSFELWSHSTGGPITAQMLKDPSFQAQVKNAVMLSPAAAVDQSMLKFGTGVLKEIARDIKPEKFALLTRYSLVMGRRESKDLQAKEKGAVFGSLLTAIRKRYPSWTSVSAQEGGKTVFYSGGKDTLTYTGQAPELGTGENQYRIDQEDGSHLTALVQPRTVISKVDAILHPEVTHDFLLN